MPPNTGLTAENKKRAQTYLDAYENHTEGRIEEFEDYVAEDDKVMVRLVHTGTHDGLSMGFEPTGEEVTFSSIVVYCFGDGKIVERWGESNSLGFLQQIDAFPSHARA